MTPWTRSLQLEKTKRPVISICLCQFASCQTGRTILNSAPVPCTCGRPANGLSAVGARTDDRFAVAWPPQSCLTFSRGAVVMLGNRLAAVCLWSRNNIRQRVGNNPNEGWCWESGTRVFGLFPGAQLGDRPSREAAEGVNEAAGEIQPQKVKPQRSLRAGWARVIPGPPLQGLAG